jgi:nucleoside-diphosphate-sugar epimerase
MSSTLALLPASGTLHADAPTRHDGPPYARSKADSERLARERQAAGAPVVTVLSGWVWGPHDPRLGESSAIVCDLVAGRLPVCPPGGASVVDVRDLGALLAALIVPGLGPRRVLAAGSPTTFPELATMLGTLTGRPRRVRVVPAMAARLGAAAADRLRRVGPRLPATGEGTWAYLCAPRTDDGDTWSHLDRPRRSLEQTVADQLAWLVDHGHVRVAAEAPVRRRSLA